MIPTASGNILRDTTHALKFKRFFTALNVMAHQRCTASPGVPLFSPPGAVAEDPAPPCRASLPCLPLDDWAWSNPSMVVIYISSGRRTCRQIIRRTIGHNSVDLFKMFLLLPIAYVCPLQPPSTRNRPNSIETDAADYLPVGALAATSRRKAPLEARRTGSCRG